MIEQNLAGIKARIALSCAKVGRNPLEIALVVISKGRSIDQLREVIKTGITNIGENRVQEALKKYNLLPVTGLPPSSTISQGLGGYQQPVGPALSSPNESPYARKGGLIWHMVGHLQTNKVKEAVKIFDLIQSVDSLPLAAEINRQAKKLNKIQEVLVEVNISAEPSKFGIKPEETIKVVKEIAEFKNLNLRGLMGIAPIVDEPEKVRPYFRMLRDLLLEISQPRTPNPEPRILSMGMSDDFEPAIEEGSNMLRLGRAIFDGLE